MAGSVIRSRPFAYVLLLLLGALALPGASSQATYGVNVVYAEDMGCSDDEEDTWFSGGADLRVTVMVDGIQVLQTAKAQNHEKPYFAARADVAAPDAPVEVRIIVEEAEPGGFFSTTWVECDVSPGAGNAYVFTWSGDDKVITGTGDDPGRAASVRVVLGSDGPAEPTITVSTGYQDAVVTWTDPGSHLDKVRWAGYTVPEASTGTDRHELDGLCDNSEYRMEVVRQSGSWLVAYPFSFTTKNIAPDPPEWTDLAPDGNNWSLEWIIGTAHDIDHYEVHAGTEGEIQPDASTLRAEVTPFFEDEYRVDADDVAMQPEDSYVLVRAIDSGGLFADSASIPLEGYQVSRLTPGSSCGVAASSSGPATGPTQTQTQTGDGSEESSPGGPTGSTGDNEGSASQEDNQVQEGGVEDQDPGDTGDSQVRTLRIAAAVLGLMAFGLITVLVAVLVRQPSRQARSERASAGKHTSWVCPGCKRPYRVPRIPGPGVVCPGCRGRGPA